MAYQKKAWLNEGDTGANDSNSVLNKTTMNDLENRIENGFKEPPSGEYCIGISHQDLNTICGNITGFYAGTDLTNAPGGNKNIWFKVMHISMNDEYQTQMAFNSSTGAIWYRSCVNGTWQSWVQIPADNGITESSLAEDGYVRFSNGLQVAWKTITLNIEPAQHGSLWYLYNTESYAWPKAFKMIFSRFASTNSPGFFAAGVNAGTVNITAVRAYRPVNDGNQATLYVVGIGTWK